ncbi:hypothetical protein CBL_20083 [Carabus blaptoides fortunei]
MVSGLAAMGQWIANATPPQVEADRPCSRTLIGEWPGVSVSTSKSVTMRLRGRLAADRPPVVQKQKVAGNSYCHLSRAVHAKLARIVGLVRRVLKRDCGLGSEHGEAMQVIMGELPWWLEAKRRKGRVTYIFIPDFTFASKTQWFDPSLRLNYILTGYGSMNGFLHKWRLEEDPGCACDEDWEHVLLQCMLYIDLRDLHGMGIVATLLTRICCWRGTNERAKTWTEGVFVVVVMSLLCLITCGTNDRSSTISGAIGEQAKGWRSGVWKTQDWE